MPASANETCQRSISGLLSNYDAASQVQLGERSQLLSEVRARADTKDRQVAALKDKHEALFERMGIAESMDSSSTALVDESDDNRAPIAHLLHINARARVSKTNFNAALEKFLQELKVFPKHVSLTGPTSGKFSKLRFKRG